MDDESSFVIQEQHPVSKRWAIFEDDDVCAYLYLTKPNAMVPVRDCWIYNRIDPPPMSSLAMYEDGPPPACVGFADTTSVIREPNNPSIKFVWGQFGESVAILIGEVPMAFVSELMKAGCSKNLLQDGPWGETWEEDKFKMFFGKAMG